MYKRQTYYQMNRLPDAAREFETALRIDPADAATTYQLGAVRLQEGNLAAAGDLFTKARQMDPDLPEVYYGLGVLYRLKGQTQDAIAAFEKFLALGSPQDPTAIEHAQEELRGLRGE